MFERRNGLLGDIAGVELSILQLQKNKESPVSKRMYRFIQQVQIKYAFFRH